MTEQERREAARQFWYKWRGNGKEDWEKTSAKFENGTQ